MEKDNDKKAVAIKYAKEYKAPMVVAKGRRIVAEKIEHIAKEHNIYVERNAKLAENLYNVNINDFIPDELYEAVAQLLVYIYQLNSKK